MNDGRRHAYSDADRTSFVRSFQASPGSEQSVVRWPAAGQVIEAVPVTLGLEVMPGQSIPAAELEKLAFAFVVNGGPLGATYRLPATGQMRTLVCESASILVTADSSLASSINLRASVWPGWAGSNDSATFSASYGASASPILIPSFTREFRVWDPVGGGTIQFYDLALQPLTGYGMPPASTVEDWHPVPYKAAYVELLPASEGGSPEWMQLGVRR